MNFGFNSNVQVGDVVYHVQTEDRGPARPFLDTVVYVAGRVVYKRSINYEKFAKGLKPEIRARKLQERIAGQHREVIAGLESGTLPPDPASQTETAVATDGPSERLELRFLNPKTWISAGNVSMEIELSEKNSKKRLTDAEVEACLEQDKRRVPCADARTNAKGCASLKFKLPAKMSDGASLVVRARDGARYGELRFRLKTKSRTETKTTASR